MTKKKIKEEYTSLDVDYSSAEAVIESLTQYINEFGAGKVTLMNKDVDYSERTYVAVMVERLETDEEEKVRESNETIRVNSLNAMQRRQYEELKKKFG